MKKAVVLLSTGIMILGSSLYAQDSTKKSAAKQIESNSEKTDAQQGKKIQQQSLLNNKFEVLDGTARPVPPKKKHRRKSC